MSEGKSRKMLLSITTLLSHKVEVLHSARWRYAQVDSRCVQDGSIMDAIMMWKSNLDQQFDGVEPCIICYSVSSAFNFPQNAS